MILTTPLSSSCEGLEKQAAESDLYNQAYAVMELQHNVSRTLCSD